MKNSWVPLHQRCGQELSIVGQAIGEGEQRLEVILGNVYRE